MADLQFNEDVVRKVLDKNPAPIVSKGSNNRYVSFAKLDIKERKPDEDPEAIHTAAEKLSEEQLKILRKEKSSIVKKKNSLPLTEEEIEAKGVTKAPPSAPQLKSSLHMIEENIDFDYIGTVDWGTFDVDRLADKMTLIAEALSSVPLREYQVPFQKRVFVSVLRNDGAELTALFSRQSGKTEVVAQTCVTLLVVMPVLAKLFPDQLGAYKRGFRIGLFAPTGEQAYTTHSRMEERLSSEAAEEFLADSEIDAKKHYSGGMLEIFGPMEITPSGRVVPTFRSFCKMQSGAKQTKIESKTYDLIVVEEAQDMDSNKVTKCLDMDTRIPMSNGSFTTLRTVINEKLGVNVPEGRVVPSDFIDNGVKPAYRLLLDNGRELIVTDTHQHVVYKDRRMLKMTTREIENHLLQTGPLKLVTPDILPYFGDIGDRGTGYMYGYRIAKGQYPIDTLFSTDKSLPEIMKKADHLYRLHSQDVDEIAMSKECVCGFLAGFTDVAGEFMIGRGAPNIYYRSWCEKLMRDLQDQFLKLGIHSKVFPRLSAGIGSQQEWVLGIRDVLSLKRFHREIQLQVNQDKLDQAVLANRGKPGDSVEWDCPWRYRTILQLEPVGMRHTGCVTVPTKEHVFYANGVLTGNSIHPMCASTNGTIVKVGTTGIRVCDFYRATVQNMRRQINSKYKDHFEYDYRVTQRANPKYREFIKRERDRLGEHSDAFRMSYNLEWLFDKGMAVTPQMFEELMRYPSGRLEYTGDPQMRYVAGLDLAKKGDSTVLTIAKTYTDAMSIEEEPRYIKQIVNWIEMTGENWEEQVDTIIQAVNAYGIGVISIDSTGLGDPVTDFISAGLAHTDVIVIPVVFSTKTKHEMATVFYRELRAKRIVVPTHPTVKKTRRFKNFYEQLIGCEKVYKGSFMALQHSDEKDAHDDYVQSLLLTCYGVENAVSPKIESSPVSLRNMRTNHSSRFEKAVSRLNSRRNVRWRQ